MSEISQQAIDHLIDQLDALDVLEFIDFHPESMQREGNWVSAFDPLSQNISGRYLKINLETKEFETNPPDLPPQRGNLLELYAQCRAIPFAQAANELADEFGILLSTGDTTAKGNLLEEAQDFIKQAKEEGPQRNAALGEAEKRLRHLLTADQDNLDVHRAYFDLCLMTKNPLTMIKASSDLLELEWQAGNYQEMLEAAERHLEVSPSDLRIHGERARALEKLGRKQEAIEALMQLADLAENARQYDLALESYRRVRSFGSDVIDVHPMIINLLVQEGNLDEAATEINHRAEKMIEEGQYAEAEQEIRRGIDMAPKALDLRLSAVKAAARQELTPEKLDLCVEDIDVLLDHSMFTMAVKALEILYQQQPDNEMIVALLISTCQSLNDKDKVIDYQVRMAEIHRANDNLPEAILLLEELVKANRKSIRLLSRMSDFLIEADAVKEAKVALGRLARLQIDKDDKEGAAGTLEKLAEIDPAHLDAREAEINLLLQLGHEEKVNERACAFAEILEEKGADERLQRVLDRVRLKTNPSPKLVRILATSWRRSGNNQAAVDLEETFVENITSSIDAADAEVRVREMLEEDPENLQLLEGLSFLLLRQERVEESTEVMEKLADLLIAEKKSERARDVLLRLIEYRPEDRDALAKLSELSTELGDEAGLIAAEEKQLQLAKKAGDFAAAERMAMNILELKFNHRTAILELFNARVELGKREPAIEAGEKYLTFLQEETSSPHREKMLRSLIELAPEREDFWQAKLSLAARGNEREAIKADIEEFIERNKSKKEFCIRVLRKSFGENPEAAPFAEALADLYEEAGRRDDMIAAMQQVISLELRKKDYPAARKHYRVLIGKAPDSVSSRSGYIELLQELGETDSAAEEHLELARLLHRQRRLEDAREAYEELESEWPDNPDVLRGHADLLRDMGRHSEASRKLRELATLYHKQQLIEQACATLNEILDREPDNHEIRRDLVGLKKEQGDTESAIKELQIIASNLINEGDWEGGLSTRREAVSMNPDSLQLREKLIADLREAGREEEVKLELVALAETQAKTGAHSEALKILEKAGTKGEAGLAAIKARARIYDAMGKEKEALAEYRKLQDALDKHDSRTSVPVSQVMQQDEFDSGLELLPEYVFESFIVGNKNQFAYATAKAVAQQPGSARNPLFLYSDVGLGKTHLLHAIANYCRQQNPNIRILYMSTEYFTSELIDAIQNNTVQQFRNRHRKSEMLLLDDVQFLAGKERSQEEFFHIFNMLHQARRQIVVTSDRPPKDISHLDMRLRSRFGQGVIVDIQSPDVETRVAILQADAKRRGIDAPDEAIKEIAERIDTNVRELKGAFNQLITQHEIGMAPLTAGAAREIVEKYFGS